MKVDANIGQKSDFPTALKEATKKPHTDLESLPIASEMMNPNVTLEQYQKYLLAMYQVINEVESQIFPQVNSVFSDLTQRSKSQLLASDLKEIGAFDLPKNQRIFDITGKSVAFLIGLLYVVEGSTLGGRYMLKNIESAIDIEGKIATTFLSGYGNSTGSMWKKFMNELSKFESTTKSSSEIIAGAQFGFQAIHRHFETS